MLVKNILFSIALLGASPAMAQSYCSPLNYGNVLTSGQWQQCFQQKQDVLDYTAVNKAGDVMTGRLATTASTALRSGFSITPGIDPVSPVDGDIWLTSTGLFVRAGGTTMGPLASSSTVSADSLGADIAMNNTTNYFTGPTVAQGTTGTWLAMGSVSVVDTSGSAEIYCKLWDGTNVISSGRTTTPGATSYSVVALSGYITNPAGNIRISCRDSTSTSGVIAFSGSSNSKDATLTAVRIQ